MALTETEAEILGALAEGKTVPEIARFRFRSADTVRSHVKNIHLKLEAKTNAQAVFLGLKLGFIELVFCFLLFSQCFPLGDVYRVRVSRSVSVRVGRVKESLS